MDLNINIKLTCDDYMVRLVDTVVRSLDAIGGAVAPMVKAPKPVKVQPAPATAEPPKPTPAKKAQPAVQTSTQAPPKAAEPAKTPAPTPKPEKVDLPELRTLTKDWLRADSSHTAALREWLAGQNLARISDISTSAQAEALKQMIKGA